MSRVNTFIEKIKKEGEYGRITGASVIFGTNLPIKISDVVSYSGKDPEEISETPLYVEMCPERIYLTTRLNDRNSNEEVYEAILKERELSLVSPKNKEKGEREHELEEELKESEIATESLEISLFEAYREVEPRLEDNWKEVQKLGSLLKDYKLTGCDVVYESGESVEVKNGKVVYEADDPEEVLRIPEKVKFEPRNIRFNTKEGKRKTYFLDLETGEVKLEGSGKKMTSRDNCCLSKLGEIFQKSNHNSKIPIAAMLTRDKINSWF